MKIDAAVQKIDATVQLTDSTDHVWKAHATIEIEGLEHTGGASPAPPIRHPDLKAISVLMGGLGDLIIGNLTNEGGKFLKITLADK